MKKPVVAFFSAKPYDRESFDAVDADRYEIRYFETRLRAEALPLAEGADAVCAFVNDSVGEDVLRGLSERGIRILALRCAGFNNVDFCAAHQHGVHVVRVPDYSPYAVAEHAMALLLALNRHLPRAVARTRDFNFSLAGLTGWNLHGKTAGIVGTGKIGRIFCMICKGFGMRVLAYDAFPNPESGLEYVSLDRLFAESDVISLHCPLVPGTHHLVNVETIARMKKGVTLINTSRGALVESLALLGALRSGHIAGAALDVYEEEIDWFYEDRSSRVRQDKVLALLLSMSNVVVTSHQAFLTHEALGNIATTTLANLDAFFSKAPLVNEVCLKCPNRA